MIQYLVGVVCPKARRVGFGILFSASLRTCWLLPVHSAEVARTKRYRERGLEPTKPELIAYARPGPQEESASCHS